MSRYGRDADLAYGDLPESNRWDRERFERVHVQQREREQRPARVDVIDDRRPTRYDRDYDPAPPQRFSERLRHEVYEDDYGRVPNDRALLPYRRKEEVDIDYERRRETAQPPPPPRPGLLRRQSSLDTFDRRPHRERIYERDDYRAPLEPVRRDAPPRREYREDIHYHQDTPHEHRDVEIYRETEIRKTRRRTRSDAKSVVSSRTSTSRTSSSSRSSSPVAPRLPGRKGHTKLPKAKFTKAAIVRFGVPYDDMGDHYKLHRALDKDSIDQILAWSKETNQTKVKTYTFETDGRLADTRDHYETIRTEWINPPSVRGVSPARTVRATTPPPVRQETKVVIQEPAPPAPVAPQLVYSPTPPPMVQVVPPPPPTQPMAVQITQRTERTHADIENEIKMLERERELVHLERHGHHHGHHHHHHHGHGNQLVVAQPVENYQVVEYTPRRRAKSEVRYEYRDRSPPRQVVRVERDKRGRMALVRSKD